MNLAIYGAGGSGREVFDLLKSSPNEREKWDELIFIDDTKEEGQIYDCKRIPFCDFVKCYSTSIVKFVIAIGEPKYREELYEKVCNNGYEFGNIIHESAEISSSAIMGVGNVFQSGVIISSDAKLGNNIYVNHRSMIGHDVQIDDNCQISANVVISGGASIGKTTFIGGQSCVRDHTAVGEYCIVSMGAAVLRDVPPHTIVMGNPARVIRNNDNEKVF